MKLIMNPGSRSGKSRKLWKVWESGLRSEGLAFESIVTGGLGDAFRICRQLTGEDTAVAVGGDGTINEVLDGVVQSGNPRLKMGVLYSGTSPDFCRFHGIPTNPEKALRCLIAGNVKRVDVARIEYSLENGKKCTAHFGCGCNIGLGASVARSANQMRRFLGDCLGTGLAAVKAIMKSDPVDLDLDIDGVHRSFAKVNNISILKSPYIASGLKLNVDLKPDDGRLMLAALSGLSRRGLCSVLPGFYTGNAVDSQAVSLTQCERVSIRAAGRQEIEFDGDPRCCLPAAIQILPKALTLILHQSACNIQVLV